VDLSAPLNSYPVTVLRDGTYLFAHPRLVNLLLVFVLRIAAQRRKA
jgi:hypothetical protein